jgi:uncharacterized protein YcbK (DUF882 family)
MRIIISAAVLAATILPLHAQEADPITASAHGITTPHAAATGYVRSPRQVRLHKRMKASRYARRDAYRRHAHAHGASASRACLTPQTRQVLAGLEARFSAVRVISTCRPGAVIAGTGRPSQHRYGKAVDFMPAPGQRAAMLAWLRSNAGGAVITYSSGHIHFDTGGYRNYSGREAAPGV